MIEMLQYTHVLTPRSFILYLALFSCCHYINTEINYQTYSFAFVYTGDTIPSYVKHSIAQARLFNRQANIFFLISNASVVQKNEQLFNELKNYNAEIIFCDILPKSNAHKKFDQFCARRGIAGYWKATTGRFFYIDDFMREYNLQDVFQIECDVMIYVNLEDYIPLLHKHHINIASPFQNDYLASMSFNYFSTQEAIHNYAEFINTKEGQLYEIDMYLLASYKNAKNDAVEHLPTIPNDFVRLAILKNQRGEIASQPWKYWNHIEEWNSIFDNDGIGSFLNDGNWRFNQAYFDSSIYKFIWEKDSQGRLIPYISSPNIKYRINTLHIAYKNLDKYLSIR